MPKLSKVSPIQRRDWLQSSETGSSLQAIAKKSGRTARTVKKHIEKAQLERDFHAVRQSQLQNASQLHQNDMFAMVDRVRAVVATPIEHLLRNGYLDQLWLDHPSLGRRATILILSNARNPEPDFLDLDLQRSDSSIEVRLQVGQSSQHSVSASWLESPLWHALTEHSKDQVWANIDQWIQAISDLIETLKSLGASIKTCAEQTFEMPLRTTSSGGKPMLTVAIVRQVRLHMFSRVVGFDIIDPIDTLQISHGDITTGDGSYLAQYKDQSIGLDEAMLKLNSVISDTERSAEWRESLAACRNLMRLADNIKRDLESISLSHFLPGTCNICKTLGSG